MSSLVIILVSGILFYLGYRLYARGLEKLFGVNKGNSVPSKSKFDGLDYIPARNWQVLFGHHFASISGAGPIVGPALACIIWGWGPTLVWIILGTIFIGGVHDFGSLIISVKESGSSVADIASRSISNRAKFIFSGFVWLALLLVIAVFAYLCADTFVKDPKIVVSSLGLIPVAMFTGFLIYNRKSNFIFVSIIGIGLLVCLILLGNILPISLGGNAIKLWIIVLLVYSYFASIIPVNILLQPRDYLCSYLLLFGLILGYLGIVIKNPIVGIPVFTSFTTEKGSLWPMMCVIVACGAISGFHSLVASGTSSKQIPNEVYAKRIGYGGMIAEALVATMVIIAVSCGITKFVQTSGSSEPIPAFSRGFGFLTDSFLGGYGRFVALVILNAFILTTLDTATRINRYITEELFKIKNRFLSTFIIILVAGGLALSGNWKKIWPAFGASNQLVAALTLFVVSCWLIARQKRATVSLIPAFFMLITTVVALLYQISGFIKDKNYFLLIICMVLLLLALLMVFDVFKVLRRRTKNE